MSNWLEIYGNKARKATAAGRIPQFAPWQLKMGPLRWTLEESLIPKLGRQCSIWW